VSIEIRSGSGRPKPPRRGRRRKYPLDRMAVGEFFEAEATYQAVWSSIRHFRSLCRKKLGCPQFQIDRNEDQTLRVTRIS